MRPTGLILLVLVMSVLCQTAPGLGQSVGLIRGTVTDSDFGAPVGGVEVEIVGTERSTVTSERGDYALEEVPPGTYTLQFRRAGFGREVEGGVRVEAGQLRELNVAMTPEYTEMAEMVVQDIQLDSGSEAALLELRDVSASMLDSISAATLSKAGVGDVAEALTLVTGASVADGKFAVIRGLPERYTVSMLNGSRLPSADEETRSVELDQFTTDVIESVQVSKTFTPEQQGDASGGTVDIILSSVPEENFISFGSGYSWNSQVWENRNEYLTYRDGGVSRFGINKERRMQPGEGGESQPPTMGVMPGGAPHEYSFDFGFGLRKEIADGVAVGAIFSTFYSQGVSYDGNGIDNDRVVRSFLFPDGRRFFYQNFDIGRGGGGDTDFSDSNLDLESASEELQWGGLGVVGLESEFHELSFAFFQTRTTEDSAAVAEDTRTLEEQVADDPDPDDPIPFTRSESIAYQERVVETIQFSGEHDLRFPEFNVTDWLRVLSPKLTWTYARSRAVRREPDERRFVSTFLPDDFADLDGPGRTRAEDVVRVWEEITEISDQLQFAFEVPFEQWTGDKGYIKAGIFDDQTTREFRRQSFNDENTRLPQLVGAGVPGTFEETFISNIPGQTVASPRDQDVGYDGEFNIEAAYWMVDLPLTSQFKLIGGFRYERTGIDVTLADIDFEARAITVERPFLEADLINQRTGNRAFSRPDQGFDPTLPIGDVRFDQRDVLPALAAVFEPIENMTFRASYAETVARPTFRELSVAIQTNFVTGDLFVGNPTLDMSSVKNYDLRLDYAPAAGTLYSISWFKKDIKNPIEIVTRRSTAIGEYAFPINFPSATLSGFELEFRQDMEQVSPKLRGLSIGANATFINSEVDLPPDEVVTQFGETSRPMIDAPEHLYNFNLTYDIEATGTEFAVFYSVKGDTLVRGADPNNSAPVPNVFAKEYGTLNLTVSQKLGKHFKLKFSAENLTNPQIEQVYRAPVLPDELKSRSQKGIDLSLSLSAEFTF